MKNVDSVSPAFLLPCFEICVIVAVMFLLSVIFIKLQWNC